MNVNPNIRRDRLPSLRVLLSAACASAALACSGEDGFAAAPMDPEEREAEFQRQHATPLSQDERIALESVLLALGADMAEIGFSGRMVTVGDAYLDAESLLSLAPDTTGLVEKGRTYSVVDNTTSVDGLKLAPNRFSQIFNGNYQFWRPDVSNVTVVVPNGTAASFLVGAFQQATAMVWGAENDCLSSPGVSVKTAAQYDAMSNVDKIYTKPIFVRYGSRSGVCPGFDEDNLACALFPRTEFREFQLGLSETRMVPGTRIGVIDSEISVTNERNVAILTHELLHTLGLAHAGEPNSVTVVGTNGSATVPSIMQGNPCNPPDAGCNFEYSLQGVDVDTIDTLYSPQPGATCAHSSGLKTIVGD